MTEYNYSKGEGCIMNEWILIEDREPSVEEIREALMDIDIVY